MPLGSIQGAPTVIKTLRVGAQCGQVPLSVNEPYCHSSSVIFISIGHSFHRNRAASPIKLANVGTSCTGSSATWGSCTINLLLELIGNPTTWSSCTLSCG